MVNWDIIIVGGGAAGIMAAISARRANPQVKVVIIERSFALGRKILVSGAGRCNLTNINISRENWEHRFVSDSPETLRNVFQKFGYAELMGFFADLGIEVYEEQKNQTGKIFPITDSAKNIVALLMDELNRVGVTVMVNTSINSIRKQDNQFVLEAKVENAGRRYFEAAKVILCAGGKTYPILGTDGTGFELAMRLGHKILTPVPAAGPVTSAAPICKELQGNKVSTTTALFIRDKLIRKETEELLFTQYGVSGSVIFYLSRAISIYFNREQGTGNCYLKINFVPGKSVKELQTSLEHNWKQRPGQQLDLSLYGMINGKLATGLIKNIKLHPGKQVKDLTAHEQELIFKTLTEFRIDLTGTRGWAESEFTSGGVKLTEVNLGTLESNVVSGLFLAGEILNVDGDVGGFNLSWAWSSGWVAGKFAVQK